VPAAHAKDSAAATGAAAIAVAATPAMNSGAMNLNFAIMFPVYHQDQTVKPPNFWRSGQLS
jgi:hypothetical protein